MPDPDFRAGRAAVLRQLLALPRLFRTPGGIAAYQERARLNLTAELKDLAEFKGLAELKGLADFRESDG